MSDTLEIFGTEYTGVTGIKATDDNGTIKTYVRPQGTKSISANGTGIDVTAYASVDVAVPSGTPSLQSKTKSYTPSESAQSETVTADSGYDGLSSVSVSVGAISSTYVGSGIPRKSSSDADIDEEIVAFPAGYYESLHYGEVELGTQGTPVATKGTPNRGEIQITPTVTNTAGYIGGGTINGTAVTVSASELVSGTLNITDNGTEDVTNYASVNVALDFSTIYTGSSTPSSSTGSNGDIYLKVV